MVCIFYYVLMSVFTGSEFSPITTRLDLPFRNHPGPYSEQLRSPQLRSRPLAETLHSLSMQASVLQK